MVFFYCCEKLHGHTISKNGIFILCASAMETMYIKLEVIYRDLWTSCDLNFSHAHVTDVKIAESSIIPGHC